MTNIYSIIKKAKKYLDNNKCIAVPTETVYGLAANAYSTTAVKKIYKLKKPDLIIGSKYLKKSKIYNRKFLRSLCSKIYTKVCQILVSSKISDYSAGFRFYSRRSLKKLIKKKQKYTSPSQHLENLFFYYENKYKISEFPAIYLDTGKNSKSIKISHLLLFACQLLNILLNFYLRKLK